MRLAAHLLLHAAGPHHAPILPMRLLQGNLLPTLATIRQKTSHNQCNVRFFRGLDYWTFLLSSQVSASLLTAILKNTKCLVAKYCG